MPSAASAASLPQIDYVDYNDVLKSYDHGYTMGKDQLSRQTNALAGQAMAKGDYTGGRNAFFQAGDVDSGLKIQQHIDSMDDRQRAATARIAGVVGNLAMMADTPEKWTQAIQGLKARGLDVSKYTDFGTRQAALAESGMTLQYLERADKLAKEAQPTYQHTEAGAFNPKEGTIKPYPEGVNPAKKTDLEKRAIAGGLVPGTPEYQDYVLSGPEKAAQEKHSELYYRAVDAGYKPGTDEFNAYVAGGPPKTSTEKWNGEQSKAANFGNMMVQAERTLVDLGPKDKTTGTPQLDAQGNPVPATNPKGFFGAVRDATYMPEGMRNQLSPEAYQTYKQAAEQWIRAKLRKESGAAIGKDEMAHEFQTYFPQYGDGPALRAQKARAREQATRGMIAESAGAYAHFFGDNEPGAAGPRKKLVPAPSTGPSGTTAKPTISPTTAPAPGPNVPRRLPNSTVSVTPNAAPRKALKDMSVEELHALDAELAGR